jgi:hypothetical protein
MLQGQQLWAVAKQMSQQGLQGTGARLLGQEPWLRTALTGDCRKVQLPLSCMEPATKSGGASCMSGAHVCLPTLPLWIANELRALVQADTGLSMFNLDVICPVEQLADGTLKLCVVDVNYFPGFDKLTDFERRFARYLKSIVSEAAVWSEGDR